MPVWAGTPSLRRSCFVGISMDDKVWHHSTFTKNWNRLHEGEVAYQFFAQVLEQAEKADLLSKERFSVDGTLIEALASLKSYRPKDEDEPPTKGGGRNLGLYVGNGSTATLDAQNHQTEQIRKTLATIGQGNLRIGNEAHSNTEHLNRDNENNRIDLYAIERNQNLQGELDMRLLSEQGRDWIGG